MTAYSSQQLAVAAGISYRTVDYWTRTGLIHPLGDANPGSGQARAYSSEQTTRAVLISRLVNAGLLHGKAAALLDRLNADEIVELLTILEVRDDGDTDGADDR